VRAIQKEKYTERIGVRGIRRNNLDILTPQLRQEVCAVRMGRRNSYREGFALSEALQAIKKNTARTGINVHDNLPYWRLTSSCPVSSG
jgi:hypothetical protein